MSLPIQGRKGASELKDYLTRRGKDSSESSSESDCEAPENQRRMNLRERLGELNSSEGEEEKDAVEMVGPPPPSALRRKEIIRVILNMRSLVKETSRPVTS